MNITETGKVLGKLAAFDQRTVSPTDIAAWHEVIGHLDVDSCLAAVTMHYRENTARAMPAEIRKLATDLQARSRSAAHRQLVTGGKPLATRTGAGMVRYVLAALADAGQDPRRGRFLGKQRAGDVAEQACREWLGQTQ